MCVHAAPECCMLCGCVWHTLQVYASPTRLHMDVNNSSSVGKHLPAPSYPDICFAVHNFEDVFDEVVRGGGGGSVRAVCTPVWGTTCIL